MDEYSFLNLSKVFHYNKRHDEQFFNMLTMMGQNKKDYRQKNSSTHQDAALFINVSTRNPAHIFPD